MKMRASYRNVIEHYTDDEKELIRHGINIVLLDGSELLTVLSLSFLFQMFSETLVYVLTFSSLRICSGGYHCRTEKGCYCLYILMYLIFALFVYLHLPASISVILLCGLFLFLKAPVQHVLNPLTKQEYEMNRRKMIQRVFLFILLFMIFPRIRASIMFAVLYNAACGMALILSENYRGSVYEN